MRVNSRHYVPFVISSSTLHYNQWITHECAFRHNEKMAKNSELSQLIFRLSTMQAVTSGDLMPLPHVYAIRAFSHSTELRAFPSDHRTQSHTIWSSLSGIWPTRTNSGEWKPADVQKTNKTKINTSIRSDDN